MRTGTTATDEDGNMNQPRRFSTNNLREKSPLSRLNLRGKLTAGNMAITLLVVLVMGVYVYLRIQEGGRQLILRVEEDARSRAEEDYFRENREQAANLNAFFENMRGNTLIASDSIRSMLEDQKLVGNLYWDATTALRRLPNGSWDNSNSEVSSIFIPAAVELSDPLIQKLNLLKHSELVFPSILEGNPDIVAIYFGGEFKETVYFPNIDLANIVPPEFDVTGRGWYVSAVPENNPDLTVVWSAPYEDAALNGLVITTSAPIVDSLGRFQGVAAMDVQINRIVSLVANAKVGNTGYAFIVDNNNRLISLPDRGYEDFGITDESAMLSEIMDPAALPSASQEFLNFMESISSEDSGSFTITLNGSEKRVAFSGIPQVGYKLVFIAPAQELTTGGEIIAGQISQETRSTIYFSILLIAIVFIAATALSFAISNQLTAPLRTLNQAASEITKGNFEVKADVKSGDELESLAVTLNGMTDTVKDLISSLERRVQERTVDLEKEIQRGEKRGKQYAAIARVAQAITVQTNLRELLPQVAQVISDQFAYYHVGIFLNDALNQYAVLAAANSEGGKRMLARGHQLKIGTQGIVGFVIGARKPRIALNVGEDSVYFNNPDLPETKSEMALPLIDAGQVLGALDVQSLEPNAFSDEDLEALTILAELVSIAIQNAKLYEQMERSLSEAEAASRQIFRENWNRLAEDYKISGYRYTAGGAAPITIAEDGNGHSPETTDRKQVVVPILMRGLEIGELAVTIPKDETIKADQMDMIRAVADRVAVIAENARLFDETTRRAERERLVSDITTKIRGNNDPQAMIETAVRELREALKVSRVDIIPQKNKSPDR
jgi:GAF domain-containing protein/HAMP domain-containing protein